MISESACSDNLNLWSKVKSEKAIICLLNFQILVICSTHAFSFPNLLLEARGKIEYFLLHSTENLSIKRCSEGRVGHYRIFFIQQEWDFFLSLILKMRVLEQRMCSSWQKIAVCLRVKFVGGLKWGLTLAGCKKGCCCGQKVGVLVRGWINPEWKAFPYNLKIE